MRPNRVHVRPQLSHRQEFSAKVAQGPVPQASLPDYSRQLGELFAFGGRLALDVRTSRSPVLAHAYQMGHVTLEGDHFQLTALGVAQLPRTPAFRRCGQTWRGDHLLPYARLRPTLNADSLWQTPNYPGMARVVACDASMDPTGVGLGALAEDGRWAVCSYYQSWLDSHESSNTAELRAVALAVALLPYGQGGTVLTDSTSAVDKVALWRRGDDHLPEPAQIARQAQAQDLFGTRLNLGVLRAVLVNHPSITVAHTHGHSGHHLNEAADSMAGMARRALKSNHPGRHAPTGQPLGRYVQGFATDLARAHRAQARPPRA